MTSVRFLKRRKLGSRVLRFGIKGADVEALQELLRARGIILGWKRRISDTLHKMLFSSFNETMG